MSYLSEELMNNGLHYNELNIKQKYDVCQFWDSQFQHVQPCNFSGSFKRIFENAKKLKSKYLEEYPFGVIEEIPETLNFRSFSHKEMAGMIVRPLYCLKAREAARVLSQSLNISTQEQNDKENMRLRDYIEKQDKEHKDLKMDLAIELDRMEKEIQDLNDSAKHFAREGKILYSEFLNQLKYQRTIDKPETQVYVKQITGE